MFFIGPLTAALCTKIGCRAVTVLGALMFGLGLFLSSYVTAVYQLFLTYSVLFGVGSSCCYYTSVLILSEYFSKRLVFANGIGLSGCGIGTLALVPLMNYLIDTSHWRETLRILSATSALLLLVGWIYFVVPAPLRNPDASSSTEPQKIFNMALLKNRAFVLWIISCGLVLFGFYIPYVHLVSRLSCVPHFLSGISNVNPSMICAFKGHLVRSRYQIWTPFVMFIKSVPKVEVVRWSWMTDWSAISPGIWGRMHPLLPYS